MPMMPSPVAGLTYAAVKVAGYALFGKALNRYAQTPARPLRFGLAKTAMGLVGGLVYLFLIVPSTALEHSSDATLFLGAIPIRLVVWSIAIGLFYGYRGQWRRMVLAVVAGTAWSYALDGVMALIYRILPGMLMPFC
jgi:hypothetical protein